MATVNTVLGSISPDKLGKTLMHEHITYSYPGWYGDITTGASDRDAIIKAGVKALEDAKEFGVKTVVDATANDTGRDPELLMEVSKKTGVNIICTTGFYTEAEGGSGYYKFRKIYFDAEKEIYEMFLKEITEGIGRTGIKAGVIKLATSKGVISDYEKMFFRAAVKAQKKTGVPIITHTDSGTMGPEQAEFLMAEGADPKRVMIGHMSDNTDIRYHLRTLEKGVYIAFDRMGIQGWGGLPSDVERYPIIIGLIGVGYAERIILSHDSIARWLGKPLDVFALIPGFCAYPTHIFKDVIPELKKGGITDEQLNTILIDNPRRIFGG